MLQTGFNRIQIGRANDRTQLAAYHRHVAGLKRDVLGRRAALGEEYLHKYAAAGAGQVIPRDTGILSLDMRDSRVVREAVAEGAGFIRERAERPLKVTQGLTYYATGAELLETSAMVAAAWSPEILAPIIRYFGMLPIFVDVNFTRPNATEFKPKTIHAFHTDPDDVTNMKVFIHLSDVDEGCGPFHALPAADSAKVDLALGYPPGTAMDEDIERVIGPLRAVPSLGPAGVVTFCDTSRCYHFGARPPSGAGPPRDQAILRFILPTATIYPQHAGDGDPPRTMPNLSERDGDEIWNAFIGASLV